MKKLIPSLLAMLLCFGMATACNKDGDSSTSEPTSNSSSSEATTPLHAHEEDLADVKEYLNGDMGAKTLDTRKSFNVLNSYTFFGETTKYDIAWSVDVEGITITEGDTEDTIVIPEVEADTAYVLTATITDPDGCHTMTATYSGKVLAALNLVPAKITEKPVAETAYKLYVYQKSKEIDCYFTGKMAATFYFGTSESYDEGVDLYVEYVDADKFNLYFEADGAKTYVGVQEAWNSKNSYWTVNVLMDDEPVSQFTWNADLGTIVSTIPARSEADKENKDAAQSTTKTVYLGNYDTKDTFSASTLDKAATSNVGGLVTMVDKDNIPDSVKAAELKDKLSIATKHTLDKEVTLPVTDETYTNATIAWSSDSTAVVINGDKMTITVPATATTVNVTATVTLGDATATKTFAVVLGPKTEAVADKTDAAAVVAAAYNLAAGETLPGDNYTLTGEITKVNTAWSADYKNITVTIKVNDKSFECYRLKSGAADASTLKVGDTITVTGKIKNYNGKVEFDSGCVLDAVSGTQGGGSTTTPTYSTPAEILTALYGLASGESLSGEFTLTGKIIELDDYKNPTIVVEGFEDKPVYCFKLKVTNAVNDVITVKATGMTNYNGKYEFTNCTLVTDDADDNNDDVVGGDTTVDSGTYSYTFPAKTFSANGTQDLGGVDWTVEGNGGYFGWDTSEYKKGQQFGSSKAPCTELTVTSESFSNVSKITINTAGAKDIAATCDVYVGETKVGTITLAMTTADYSFDVAGLTGAVKFVYTQTSSKAIYIKSITVECAE